MQVKNTKYRNSNNGNIDNFSITSLHLISVLEKEVTVSYSKNFTISKNQTNRATVCSPYQVNLFNRN